MASITIRNLDEETKRRLRIQAAQKGRSMEEEARKIIQSGVQFEPATPGFSETVEQPPNFPVRNKGLGTYIHELFKPLGGVELELPPRTAQREPPDFSGPEYGE